MPDPGFMERGFKFTAWLRFTPEFHNFIYEKEDLDSNGGSSDTPPQTSSRFTFSASITQCLLGFVCFLILVAKTCNDHN